MARETENYRLNLTCSGGRLEVALSKKDTEKTLGDIGGKAQNTNASNPTHTWYSSFT